MDPLSIIAGSIAIFDALKEAYRFAEDVIKAPEERDEFTRRLDCVADIKKILGDCLAKEGDPENSEWVKLLDAKKNPNSPLAGLGQIMQKMLTTLKTKETSIRKWKDFKWHSEKKSLESYFVAIDGCCTRIVFVLSTANIEISRLSRENNALLKDTNAITRKMAANQEAQMEVEKLDREESDRKAIERWLSPLDFQSRQREIFEAAAKTGKWFMEREEFKCWKKGELEVLRCHGRVGTGKTVLSSIVVDHLRQEASSLTPILCLFLEKASSKLHTPKNLLGSLVKQLVQLRESSISSVVQETWKKSKRADTRPSLDIMKKLLSAEADEYDWVYIVIDALDEASDEGPGDTRGFIEKELRRVSKKLKILTMARVDEDVPPETAECNICAKKSLPVYYRCTGCPEKPRFDLCPDCKAEGFKCSTNPFHEVLLPRFIEVQIKVPPTDLEIYVRAMIKGQAPDKDIDRDMESERRTSTKLGQFCTDDKFLNEIVEAILGNSYNKFLLAKLYINSVSNKITKKKILGAITKLKGAQYDISDRIGTLYEQDLIARIKGQDSERAEVGIKILSIVYFARRLLNLDELRQIWAANEADSEDTDYDPLGMIDSQDILKFTGGFITIGREDEVIRFDDRTLTEFFDKRKSEWFPDGEKYVANLCLRYLGFDTFSKPCPSTKLAARDEEHPFFAYAVQYWGDHVREAGPDVEAAAVKYLEDASRMEAYIQGAWETNTYGHDKWDVRRNIHALHVCAWFDLAKILNELDFKTIQNLDVQEKTYGQTPLMYACRRGNADVARSLLKMGAKVNISSARGRTALHEAVLRKDNDMVQLLLDNARDINVNLRNPLLFDRSALLVAIRQGSTDVAKSILKYHKVSVDLQDSQGNTALWLAALTDQGDVVDVLLAMNAKLDLTETSTGRSAMVVAAELNHSGIVTRLLDHGADPNLPKDLRGGTAALRAAENGHIETLQVLIGSKADLSAADEDGRTLMHCAAEYGHVDILELLKKHNLSVNSPCLHGMTPLHSACRMGEWEAAEFLLESGADCAAKDKFARTPYMVAWQYGENELMDLLRDKGTNREIDSVQNIHTERLPIWSLVRLSRLDLITGASLVTPVKLDLSIKEPVTGNTALHCAIMSCDGRSGALMLQELLSLDSKSVNEPNKARKTPLHFAVAYNCLECTNVLINFKAKTDEVDRYGYTPLAVACSKEYLSIAVTLVEAGAQVRDTRVMMQKLLFAAIELQSVKAVQNLMVAGADRMAQDEYGRTADILARRVDDGEGTILRILQSHRSFMYHPVKAEKTLTSSVMEVFDEEPGEEMVYRPAFPRPAGLDERELCAV